MIDQKQLKIYLTTACLLDIYYDVSITARVTVNIFPGNAPNLCK